MELSYRDVGLRYKVSRYKRGPSLLREEGTPRAQLQVSGTFQVILESEEGFLPPYSGRMPGLRLSPWTEVHRTATGGHAASSKLLAFTAPLLS